MQTSIYDGNSELMTRTTYSYNSRGYEDGYKLFDQEDILVEEERRDLDREGRVKKLKIYGECGVLEQTLKLSYNETGDVERILVDMVEPKSKLTIEYDYEYDEYGNWDSCLITVQSDDNEDEMTLYIVMRDITYFE